MGKALNGDFRKFMDKNFLGSWDVPEGKDLILTIDHCERNTVQNQNGSEEKLTIHFVEDYKPMICNMTNAKAIAAAHGSPKVEKWAGKKIAIYTARVPAFGKTTDGLRVRDYAPKSTEYICADCGKIIRPFGEFSAEVIAERSKSLFNEYVCFECANKRKDAAE